jgi:hypothetical protein
VTNDWIKKKLQNLSNWTSHSAWRNCHQAF